VRLTMALNQLRQIVVRAAWMSRVDYRHDDPEPTLEMEGTVSVNGDTCTVMVYNGFPLQGVTVRVKRGEVDVHAGGLTIEEAFVDAQQKTSSPALTAALSKWTLCAVAWVGP